MQERKITMPDNTDTLIPDFAHLALDLRIIIVDLLGPKDLLRMRATSKREKEVVDAHTKNLIKMGRLKDVHGQIIPVISNQDVLAVLNAWVKGLCSLDDKVPDKGEWVAKFDSIF